MPSFRSVVACTPLMDCETAESNAAEVDPFDPTPGVVVDALTLDDPSSHASWADVLLISCYSVEGAATVEHATNERLRRVSEKLGSGDLGSGSGSDELKSGELGSGEPSSGEPGSGELSSGSGEAPSSLPPSSPPPLLPSWIHQSSDYGMPPSSPPLYAGALSWGAKLSHENLTTCTASLLLLGTETDQTRDRVIAPLEAMYAAIPNIDPVERVGDGIGVSWSGFSDVGFGIVRTELGIGSSPGAADLVPWMAVEESGAAVVTRLGLVHGATYYSTIRVFDAGGRSVNVTSSGTTSYVSPPPFVAVEDDVEYTSNCSYMNISWSFASPHASCNELERTVQVCDALGSYY